MDIRAVAESEFDEMIDVICRSFRPNGHERYRAYSQGDPSYRPEQSRVVVVDGRIVATLRVWHRTLTIGSRAVSMGGIGSVCTNPEFRGRGYASALMRDSIAYMRDAAYAIGGLFSAVPTRFYSELGWGLVPLGGFVIKPAHWLPTSSRPWSIDDFREEADLDAVMALYERSNRTRSGTLVRPREYWDAAPSRIRGVMPSVVARRNGRVEGFLNYSRVGEKLAVNEIGCEPGQPEVLEVIVDHLAEVAKGDTAITEISGEIPHSHPLVDLVRERCSGNLRPVGNSQFMLFAVNLEGLVRQLLPEWQDRIEELGRQVEPVELTITLNDQQVSIRHDGTTLSMTTGASGEVLELPASLLWRAFLGESSWADLEPGVVARGQSLSTAASSLLRAILSRREVTFWAPDHF